jgi:hypothetical protein
MAPDVRGFPQHNHFPSLDATLVPGVASLFVVRPVGSAVVDPVVSEEAAKGLAPARQSDADAMCCRIPWCDDEDEHSPSCKVQQCDDRVESSQSSQFGSEQETKDASCGR